MPNNTAQHGWVAEKNLNVTCAQMPFPNFLFSRTAIFYSFFFPEIKTMEQWPSG